MKTKIIYISGSEVFDMADIRAAFDEVRAALSLGQETVLFGVPVDNDDALADVKNTDKPDVQVANIPEPVIEPIHDDDIPTVIDSEPAEQEIDMPVEKPKKTTRRTRAKVIPITSIEPEPAPEPEQPAEEKTEIPILSVLGAKAEAESEPEVEPEPIETKPINVAPIDITPVDTAKESHEDKPNNDTQSVSITDMLADESAPVETREKTLEELLESMTPLGEDEKIEQQPIAATEPEIEIEPIQTTNDDTDATLELLATEFAESADKIVAPAKPETRGKIGKLKNILPFKKAKRDDSGIMGDLFGWAGVANDEDFTIPGFFANAKK